MIAIVGAGPSGLALAYYLKKTNLEFCMLEQFEVGSSWSRMYDHVRLHSLKQHSALPGLAMPGHYPKFPSGQQLHAYLQAYARHFGFKIHTQTRVLGVSYAEGWELETSQGTMQASHLIAATGIYNTPFLPRIDGLETFPGTVIHSQAYQRPQDFAGKRVLVVGVGNSGAEIAVALAQAGIQCDIVVRNGALFVSYPRSAMLMALKYRTLRLLPAAIANRLLKPFQHGFDHLSLPLPEKAPLERYPVVGFELPELAARGELKVQSEITRIEGDTVHFKSGQKKSFDSIILATGFRPTLDFIPEHLQTHPRFYTLGFHYPTTEPFLWSIQREARQLARRIEASAKLDSQPGVFS